MLRPGYPSRSTSLALPLSYLRFATLGPREALSGAVAVPMGRRRSPCPSRPVPRSAVPYGAGFVVIGIAWDGAREHQLRPGQIPYLLSGGFHGLALIITGATLLFLSTIRSERQLLTDRFDEMARLLSRNLSRLQVSSNGAGASTSDQVVAGATTYHRMAMQDPRGQGRADDRHRRSS